MQINASNYYSQEANQYYMSVSQFKDFLQCEARAVAVLTGEHQGEESDAFLLGRLLHAWNDGTIENFKKENPKLYKKDGQLYQKYEIAEGMIHVLQQDKLAMLALEGEKEVIMTAELFGVPWKIRMDNYHPEKGRFTDLKTVIRLNEKYWNVEEKRYESFVEHFGYLYQVAVYAEIERLHTGRTLWLEPLLVAVTKETPPDKAIIGFDEQVIEETLAVIERKLPRVIQVKQGLIPPVGCGHCDYCRGQKRLSSIVHYSEVLQV